MSATIARRLAALEGTRRPARDPGPSPDLSRLTEAERADLDALAARVRWDGTLLGLAAFDALDDDELARLEHVVKRAHGR